VVSWMPQTTGQNGNGTILSCVEKAQHPYVRIWIFTIAQKPDYIRYIAKNEAAQRDVALLAFNRPNCWKPNKQFRCFFESDA